jgi:alpha-D-ribose 1-methylphosphonate 5-triphosphate diphosphatase
MDHTPGQRQFVDVEKLRVYYRGRHHMDDVAFEAMIVDRKKAQELYADKHRAVLVDMAKDAGLPMASHDDATEDHVNEAVEHGITISEFPTTLTAARAAHAKGMTTIMGGPNVVRGGSHSGNVSAGELAENGLLHALSSDYVPASLLHGALLLNEKHGIALPHALATVTRNPADMIGMDDRGRIAAGKRADLVRFKRLPDGVPIVRRVWREGIRVL